MRQRETQQGVFLKCILPTKGHLAFCFNLYDNMSLIQSITEYLFGFCSISWNVCVYFSIESKISTKIQINENNFTGLIAKIFSLSQAFAFGHDDQHIQFYEKKKGDKSQVYNFIEALFKDLVGRRLETQAYFSFTIHYHFLFSIFFIVSYNPIQQIFMEQPQTIGSDSARR